MVFRASECGFRKLKGKYSTVWVLRIGMEEGVNQSNVAERSDKTDGWR